MRFYFEKKKEKKKGDTRVIKRFLLFPKMINRELRWLETAKIFQRLGTRSDFDGMECWHWYDQGWVKD